jgi:hypothetical protein
MNQAYFRVSPPILAEMLHMPAGAEVVGVDWDGVGQSIRVFVNDPSFPPVLNGTPLPEIQLVVTGTHSRSGPYKTYKGEWQA